MFFEGPKPFRPAAVYLHNPAGLQRDRRLAKGVFDGRSAS